MRDKPQPISAAPIPNLFNVMSYDFANSLNLFALSGTHSRENEKKAKGFSYTLVRTLSLNRLRWKEFVVGDESEKCQPIKRWRSVRLEVSGFGRPTEVTISSWNKWIWLRKRVLELNRRGQKAQAKEESISLVLSSSNRWALNPVFHLASGMDKTYFRLAL